MSFYVHHTHAHSLNLIRPLLRLLTTIVNVVDPSLDFHPVDIDNATLTFKPSHNKFG